MTVPADFYPDAQPTSARVPWAVTDPAEIARIGDRVRYGALPWWQRFTTEPPAGWPSTWAGRAFRRALTAIQIPESCSPSTPA